jgi:hypothetical protein
MNNACCVVEHRTRMDVEAFFYREALHALEQNFDEANVLAMSPLSQEVYWKLKGGGLTQVVK